MDPALPGARLSQFRLGELLGSGGMGSVYRAYDSELGRDVAIKFIAADRADDPTARRRLVHEARAAAALDHPNICAIHEVIDEPGSPACIVMQHVKGETLAGILRRGPLEVRTALTLAAEIAGALSAAHRQGIIHRDLKPQNVIVTPERHAKLLDFGIARAPDSRKGSGDSPTETAFTLPGALVGTLPYMSPEQVRGRPLDGRSDLFSLGAVLYECLTGRRPFLGPTPSETAAQILSEEPPAVSSIRPELNDQHDELCRRLLAKEPDDRFESADEVNGAIRLLTNTWTGNRRTGPDPPRPARAPRRVASIFIALVLVSVSGVAWWRARPVEIPLPNPQAADWYRRGTELIRDGAPHGARRALTEATRSAPGYAPAYIRLAEAESELDDPGGAQQALLRVSDLVRREDRLPFEERKRVQAVRSTMLRDVDGAVRAYEELSSRRPNDPGVWLDLGRAQDASGARGAARRSFERAIQISDQYAPAHLRRGSILGLEGDRDGALAAFAEAERLYRASANVEGQVETLIRRGTLYTGRNELQAARTDLERARDLADGIESSEQRIRAQLALSSVTVSEGRWEEAERMATVAVGDALTAGLETVAAEGLVDLALPLYAQGRTSEADAHLVRAIQLAEKRQVPRLAMRATLQRAAIMVDSDKPAEGLAAARGPLEFFVAARYRRYEPIALTIMARAHGALGQYTEARTLAAQALQKAADIKDDAIAGEALEVLASSSTGLGALPDALEFRGRGLEIHRREKNVTILPYDLTNRAELLVRLGRHSEAAALLDEIDAGVLAGQEAYAARARRANVLRALSAAIAQQPADVKRYAAAIPSSGDPPDSTSRLASFLVQYAHERGGVRPPVPAAALPGSLASLSGRELRYWYLAAGLASGDSRVLEDAGATLAEAGAATSYEFEWRVAAIAAAAAQQVKQLGQADEFAARARRALERLRAEWKSDVASYEARPDLVELRRRAGL